MGPSRSLQALYKSYLAESGAFIAKGHICGRPRINVTDPSTSASGGRKESERGRPGVRDAAHCSEMDETMGKK